MSYHEGPTYQHINPKAAVGALLVVFVFVGFLSMFDIQDVATIIACILGAIIIFVVARATIIKSFRASNTKRSLLTKEDELFETSHSEAENSE
jgi:glycopeptide antibiotics resistance protein